MKKTIQSFKFIFSGLIVALFLWGCGGGSTSTNPYLGKLPGIAKKYKDEIGNKKEKLVECTDLKKAFKLDKEIKLLKKESATSIKEYLVSNPITNVPFEQKADYPFKIKKVWVEGASFSRINYRATVTITKDILNSYGHPTGYKNNFFAYVIALDKEGNALTKRRGVFMNASRKPFKANMEVEMYGSLDGPADLTSFEKLVFVPKKDANKKKSKKFKE